MDWLREAAHWLVELVHQMGYFGIFFMSFLESTFVPIPAEMTMVPAGYLVQQGRMDFALVLFLAILGTVCGASFNYWLARRFGRALFIRYGKYLMMTPEKLANLERFFFKHGVISTFTGRLIPGVRHCISFPAGLARMDLKKFIIYTTLGGSIWMTLLVCLGYYIGENEELVTIYLPMIKLGILGVAIVGGAFYGYRHYQYARHERNDLPPPPV